MVSLRLGNHPPWQSADTSLSRYATQGCPQGGDATYNNVTANGGHGGHSSGYTYLEKGTIIYVAVGGAGEDTILARVGEGIVSSIGSASSHKQVLENPDSISKLVLSKGLDAGTAFEILSIDIADVDVGKNIGAQLQMDQAEADKNIAQAKAEERRAMAIANEQEMKAKAQEARAKVIEAEALVPQAMADAFRNGNLGIMDYYRMQNIQADTQMREQIAGTPTKAKK